MAEHENSIGASDEWYTPPDYFDAMGVTFDLDPCSPNKTHWVPAKKVYTKSDDGLSKNWHGFVFMNPPFGGRNGHVVWLEKFIAHNNGIAVVRSYTSAGWFHKYMLHMNCWYLPKGKTKFIKENGEVGKAPGHAVIFAGLGDRAKAALKMLAVHQRGIYLDIKP